MKASELKSDLKSIFREFDKSWQNYQAVCKKTVDESENVKNMIRFDAASTALAQMAGTLDFFKEKYRHNE
jgi:hypothetical protein